MVLAIASDASCQSSDCVRCCLACVLRADLFRNKLAKASLAQRAYTVAPPTAQNGRAAERPKIGKSRGSIEQDVRERRCNRDGFVGWDRVGSR